MRLAASCAPLPPSLQLQRWHGHPRLRPCATRYPVDALQGAADTPGGIHGRHGGCGSLWASVH